jgi:hypothetical protein
VVNDEKEPDYQSRVEQILRFVDENPNCTKADVIRHMLGRSAVTTTHAILKDMIQEGKLNIYKKNLQTHLLTINEKNEFIKIFSWLLEIEKFMGTIYVVTMSEFEKGMPTRRIKVKDAFGLITDFQMPYQVTLRTMLTVLTIRIKNKIHSDKDQYVLFAKIIKLITSVNPYYQNQENEVLNDMINEMKKLRPNKEIQNTASEFGVDLGVIDDMILIAERFKRDFIEKKLK